MPWEVPITVGDQTYPVQFNTEAEPTQTDIDEAVAQILSGQQGQTAPAEVEDTGQSRFSSAMSNLGRGALSIIPGAIGGLGYLAEPVIGPGLKEVGEDIEQDIEKMLPVNPAYQDEFSQKAAGAVGQAIGMLGTGGVAGALGKGAAVARGLGAAEAAAAGTQLAGRTLLGSGFLSGSRQGGQAAEQYGMEGLSAYTRAILGGGIEYATEKYLFGLGSEVAPIGRMLGLAGETKGLGSALLRTGSTEAGEEAAAQVGGNIATKALAPSGVETPGVGSGVGEAAALGGVAGLTFGGVSALMPQGETQDSGEPPETISIESGEMPLPESLRRLGSIIADIEANPEGVVTTTLENNKDVLPVTAAVSGAAPAPSLPATVAPAAAAPAAAAPAAAAPAAAAPAAPVAAVPAAVAPAPAAVAPAPAAVAPAPAPASDSMQEVESAATEWDKANKNRATSEWFDGDKTQTKAFNEAANAGANNLQAHGMAKEATLTGAVRTLFKLLQNGVDPNRGGGQLYTAQLALAKGQQGVQGATASGTAYRDGPFILVQNKEGSAANKGITDTSSIAAILVNEANIAQLDSLRKAIQAIRPDIIVAPYSQARQVTEAVLGKATQQVVAPAPAVVSQTPPTSEQQTELSVEGETQTAPTPEQPVSTEPPIAEAPVVTGAAEEVDAPTQEAEYEKAIAVGDTVSAQNLVDRAVEQSVQRQMVDPEILQPSEEIRSPETVEAIEKAYQGDEQDIDWSEQPAIVITPDGVIRDGHHRYEAWKKLGFSKVPVIVVPTEAWEKVADSGNVDPLVRWASDLVGDPITGYQSNIKAPEVVEFDFPPVRYSDSGEIIPLSERFTKTLPSTETAPQTTTPKPQDASIQNEVQEAGGPPPVEGQPPQTRPEGQAQEGAAQRSREGEEGQQVLTSKVDPNTPDFGSTNTVFTKEKAEEARKVLRRKLGGQFNLPAFDPELFSAATNYAGYLIEGGVRSIADFSANMVKEFGEGIRPYIKGLYNGVRDIAEFEGMDDASKVNEVLGEATPAAAAPAAMPAAAPVAAPPLARSEPKQETPKVTPTGKASPAEVVDLRRSAMDEERKRLGLPPLAQPIQKAIGDDQMYDLAMQEFEKNPLIGSTLVDMVNTRPRSLNSLEIAILGIEIANRRNAVDMADNAASADPKNQALQDEYQKAVARYDDAQQALPLGISDVGRALRLMRVLLEQDFSKEGLIRKFRQSSGGVAPNEQQVKEIEELSKEVLDAENKVEELRAARVENARLQETIDNMLTHMKANFVKELQAVEKANKEASEAIKTASKPGKGEKSSLAIWKEKILARRAERRKKVMADPFLFNALLDAFDDVLLGAIKIAEGIRNAAQWATEMREENPEFTEYTDDQLEEIRQASQAYYDSNLKGILAEEKAPKEKKITKEKKEAEATEAETEELESEEEGEKVFATFDDVTARDVYHMVRDRVQKGMTKVEDVMKSVTEELKKQLPDVTERQVRDRFSGYGNPLFPSGGDIAKKVRELRTLAQYASKIEDAQRKIAPLRAGKQREAATDAIRAAQKELYRLMKDNGLEMASGNRAIKTPLDVVKSRLRNSIADLDRQVKAKKRDVKSTKEVARDTEAADLENQAKILRDMLNEIDPPKQPSFQDKAKARMKSISKEIVSLRQKLANKDITKPESEPIINQQIQVLLNERDALKQAMDELRLEIEGEPYLTQDEINERAEKILDRNIKSLETEIKELQDPNFYPQPAQKAENTPTIIRLKAQQEVLRKQRDELKTQRFGKKTKSQEDLLDAAIASAEKSINDLNDRINREETATKARTPKFVETAKLRNLRAERNSLRSVMFAMRKAKAEAAKDPVLEQIKRDRKYLETRTKYYEDMADKLRNGTYKPKVKEARKFNDSLGAELKRLDDAKMRVADIMLQQRLKNRSSLRKAFDFLGDLFGLQRVITATSDLSAIANQGNFILFSNPRIAMKAIPDMLRAMRTEEGEKEVQERIRNMPEYQNGEFKRAGLYLAMDAGPNAPLSKMEEQYASRLVAKWPKLLGGGLVRGSERAYKTFLDVIRATSYKVLKESLVTGSIFRPPQQSTQENLEAIANLINNATGRGVFKMKKADQLLSQAAPFLNTFIFAARFGISRFAMALGLPLWRASPQTRALIAEQYAKYIFGIYMATLLLSLGQDDDDEPIQLDFRSTDAGKLRFDDNRVDLLGGFQQPLVFLTRLLTGETVTAKGKLKPLREGDRPLDLFRDFPLKGKPSYGAMSGDSLIGSFLRFKLAPTTASILNALAGKDPVGNKTNLKSEIIKAPIPLQVSQIFEILGSQQDDPATAALLMGLGATGVRTTFQGKNAEKDETAWDNMVNKVNELLGEK